MSEYLVLVLTAFCCLVSICRLGIFLHHPVFVPSLLSYNGISCAISCVFLFLGLFFHFSTSSSE